MHVHALRAALLRTVLLTIVIMHFDATVARRPPDIPQGMPRDRHVRLWIGMPCRVPVVAQI